MSEKLTNIKEERVATNELIGEVLRVVLSGQTLRILDESKLNDLL